MIQYILECIAFQLVFLIIYDFFLKRETFFQWNRLYLMGTYILSLVLPWIKVEAFKTNISENFIYPEYLWNVNDGAVVIVAESSTFDISWEQGVFFGGMLIALLFFGHKMWQLYSLRRQGKVVYFKDFTQIVISNSSIAFSFFKSIFLGDEILKREHKSILAHELVHIRQRHTWDLLFFEFMRIVGWFNPLVYVYQNRISELHEFIADAQAAKVDKVEHCELLLSQAFQTQNISFINQFFNSSLIKKRIVMLTKEKSLGIWKLKYLALVPILIGMLFYTSCEQDISSEQVANETITVGDIENLSVAEESAVLERVIDASKQSQDWVLTIEDESSTVTFMEPTNENSFISGPSGVPIKARMLIESKVLPEDFSFFKTKLNDAQSVKAGVDFPFSTVEEVPIYPGCEDDADPRACFQKNVQKHISKNFRYPEEAQKQGIQGRVSIMFTIDEEGYITNIRKRGPDASLEDEAVRIIEKLPQMSPGKNGGKAVRVPFSIPINFKLVGSSFGMDSQDANDVIVQKDQLSKMGQNAQEQYRNGIPFSQVDQVPIFPGCEDASDARACFQEKMQRHIAKNFSYPEKAIEEGIQGRVSILFLIDENGNIGNIATRGPDKTLEDEANRIISRLPQDEARNSRR